MKGLRGEFRVTNIFMFLRRKFRLLSVFGQRRRRVWTTSHGILVKLIADETISTISTILRIRRYCFYNI